MSDQHQGSCLCGSVQFDICGSFEHFFLCHCTRCQKNSGSAHAANLFATGATLTWTRGQDDVRHFQLPDTRHARAFCQHCGSALPNTQMDGTLLVVPAGSLDSQVPIQPKAHIFCTSRASWDHDLEHIPHYDNLPG